MLLVLLYIIYDKYLLDEFGNWQRELLIDRIARQFYFLSYGQQDLCASFREAEAG